MKCWKDSSRGKNIRLDSSRLDEIIQLDINNWSLYSRVEIKRLVSNTCMLSIKGQFSVYGREEFLLAFSRSGMNSLPSAPFLKMKFKKGSKEFISVRKLSQSDSR